MMDCYNLTQGIKNLSYPGVLTQDRIKITSMQCICCIGGLVSALSSNVGFLDDDITKTAKWRRFMHGSR